MQSVQKSIRMPKEIFNKAVKSKQNMIITRGKEPSLSAWIIEAMAEKLQREENKD
jgi:hypothetical protein